MGSNKDGQRAADHSDSETNAPNAGADHVVLGMAAALAAFFLFTVMNVCAKLLADEHSVIEITFWRNLVALLPFLAIAVLAPRRRIHHIQARPMLVILRSVLGAVSLMVTFAAFSLMPMADTTVLMFTSSLFIPLLGIVFLKESVGPWRRVAVVAALPMPWVGRWPSLDDLPLLLGVGLSGLGAQFCLTIAFKNAQAAIVTVFNYSSIVWATLFGWLIWDEWPLPVEITGAAVVIASNVVMIWRESRVRRIRGDRVRAGA